MSAGDDGEAAGRLAADVWRLSRLARAKYRIIRVAVWLLIAAVAALAIALPLGQH
ncbi:Pycsar system effector family protein [Streptosporangium roseum]|uniref:Pycsar system effector family protein n=1 Tax=Streptosporangium roseum TaxID=2001 RepID=UPI003AFB549E